MKPEIMKVKIKMGTVEVELTLEEAKELQRTLNDAFGNSTIMWPPYQPYPWYDPRPYVPYWTVTTSDSCLNISSGQEYKS